MKKLYLILTCLFVCLSVCAKDPEVTVVSVVGENMGNGNRPIVRATCAAKKADKVTDKDLCLAAVRCLLFDGWSENKDAYGIDVSAQHPAIAGNPDVETAHADFFNDFFNSGEYLKYSSVIPDTRKVMKSGKLFNVSSLVNVNAPALRQKLERDNIIKSLRSGW